MDELPLDEIKKKKYSSRQGKNSKKALRRLDTHELSKEENPKKSATYQKVHFLCCFRNIKTYYY